MSTFEQVFHAFLEDTVPQELRCAPIAHMEASREKREITVTVTPNTPLPNMDPDMP